MSIERLRRQTGARAIAQALIENGVTDLFGVHGYINPVIEAACELGAKLWHFRHEQSAGFAADAYARALRRPAVCFASASAGMANYLAPLSQAIGARSPVVLIVGQHGTAGDHLNTLQEGYAAEAFKTVAKWTHRCTDWELNKYWVQKALVDSMSYPPGPVVLEFPLNNQFSFGTQPQRKYAPTQGLPALPQTQADPQLVDQAASLLARAERPLLIAGDGVYWSRGEQELQALARVLNAPTGTRRTARGAMPEDDPLAFSAGYRSALFAQADTIVTIGMTAGELDSWFEPPDWPRRSVTYIQIQETVGELWHALPAAVNLVGSARLVLGQLSSKLREGAIPDKAAWLKTLSDAREKFRSRRAQRSKAVAETPTIHTHELAQAIVDAAEPDATVIYDSYSGSLFLTDAVTARYAGQVLDAGPRVALGQGVGMCFGAGVARPGKQVVCLIGDGGIGLSGMDLETLARYNVPAVVVVLNNSSWGGNTLARSDIQPAIDWDLPQGMRYDEMFKHVGCYTAFVRERAELLPALKAAFASKRPALINVMADVLPTETSLPWLRLKIGEFYSRGIEDLSPALAAHFQRLSPLETLRLHKTAADNGTQMPLGFLADLTGHPLSGLQELAERTAYVV